MTRASLSKRSAESDTASPRNLFRAARLRLTGLYVLIIAIIICGFSLFLYQGTVQNLSDAGDEDFTAPASQQHFITTASERLQHTLLLSDFVILLLVAGIGYFLAARTLRPVEASHEAQRLFAAHASHELRTPLAIMRNDIEVLLRDPRLPPEQVRLTLASSLEEIEKLTTMTEDLLFLARSEHTALAMKQLDLAALCTRTIQKLQPIARQKGVALSFAANGSPQVQGNEGMLSRALINIVQNSLDHTPAGGSVTTILKKDGGHATVSVSDTGSGISAGDLSRVFSRFYKGASGQGTGLGLAIVKEIIEHHAGTVSIESAIDKGTTVTFLLPLA
ncbi:MAG: histidine kinase [Parcubacteria group bacterium]|nr:histidine kinase [Parcubacteria group bacterium]